MIGKEILNYTIVSLIGKGGMGSVYLAENKFIKQQKVAIKVINGNMVNDFTRRRLAEEADRLARMNHPNIVHFINYHIDDTGTIYLIMEYADGYSLEEYIKKVSGLIVEEKICSFFEPILDAFAYAHEHNIIHKDIKPANIVITNEGIPKILDFGIASLLDEAGDDTDKDVIMGTPSYMSPEQVKGQTLDQRSDIYSLGVLLHQMLTGNPPYDTTTLTEHEIYKHVVEENLPRMKTYYKYVSDKVQVIVDKATAKKTENRYQSCKDFKKALHKAIYPDKISKGAKAAIVAAVCLLIGGGFILWDYTRVKVTYYKDYAEKWGVPQGIGKISNSDRSKVHRMYRFESKNYKLQRVSHVNSLGIIIDDGESERYERPLDVVFSYNNDNKVSRAKIMDHNGQVLYIKSFNEKLTTITFQFNDEYGTEKTIGNETVGYVHAFASNQDRGKISRYLLEYDGNGYVTTLKYAGFQNILVGDANGIYGKRYVRDEKGRVLEEIYLAHDGSPKATKWGLGKKVFEYDENDNWVKASYLTIDGEPTLDAADGTSVCENVYDRYGNSIAQYFKNAEGDFMLPGMQGFSGVLSEYDEKGFQTKQSLLGIDGKVEFSAKAGYAYATMECDEYGFFNKISYFDLEGNPCAPSDGCAMIKSVNDAKGNELEKWYYDTEGKLIALLGGNAGEKFEYDSRGLLKRSVYYGVDGEPCEISDGYAGVDYELNEVGDVIKYTYLGTDLKPIKNNSEVCVYTYERDIRGNITKMDFYDEDGKPTLNTEGIATIEYKYDDFGNEILRKFYDTKGKLTKGYIGFAQHTWEYDDNGHLIKERYLDTNGKLILVDGNAGTDYKRDARGNMIENIPIGLDEKLAKGSLIARYKYDDKDNVIEFAVYDSDGTPKLNSQNYHKYTEKYNSRNQSIETAYYNTTGELTNYSDRSYCISRSEYNVRGQQTRISFFDKNNKPTTYKGSDGKYSSWISEYDKYGRVSRQLFFDTQGNPTKVADMVPEGICKYDKWGNMIYLASCDGKGNLIINPKTGWSYMESEYDKNGNEVWIAYFNDKKTAILCSDGYHKKVSTYTKANEIETYSYFNTNGKPMLVQGYHKEVYKYNDANQATELAYFGTNGNKVNCTYGYHKIAQTYNSDGTVRSRKYYTAAGKEIYHEQYINGSWVEVKNWQRDVEEFAAELPVDLGEDSGNLVIKSARVVNSSKVELVIVTPKSKYDMADSTVSMYKEFLSAFTEYVKTEIGIPKAVTVNGILKDSKGRIISTINK